MPHSTGGYGGRGPPSGGCTHARGGTDTKVINKLYPPSLYTFVNKKSYQQLYVDNFYDSNLVLLICHVVNHSGPSGLMMYIPTRNCLPLGSLRSAGRAGELCISSNIWLIGSVTLSLASSHGTSNISDG